MTTQPDLIPVLAEVQPSAMNTAPQMAPTRPRASRRRPGQVGGRCAALTSCSAVWAKRSCRPSSQLSGTSVVRLTPSLTVAHSDTPGLQSRCFREPAARPCA